MPPTIRAPFFVAAIASDRVRVGGHRTGQPRAARPVRFRPERWSWARGTTARSSRISTRRSSSTERCSVDRASRADAGPRPFGGDPMLLGMFGMPTRSFVSSPREFPGPLLGVEMVEIKGLDRKPVHPRPQDPGGTTLILLVRDITAAFAPLKKAGVPVVTPVASRSRSARTRRRAASSCPIRTALRRAAAACAAS